MTSLEALAPNLRRAIIRWPNAQNLKQRYDDLSESYTRGSDSIIEHCKGYLETIAITLITEMGGEPLSNGTLTAHIKKAREALGIVEQRGSREVANVLSGHNKIADALNNLRNQEGAVAHGRDGYLDAMSHYHRRIYILTADAIAGLLLEAYEGKEPSLKHTRDSHDRFQHLNEKINSAARFDSYVDSKDGSIVVNVEIGDKVNSIELRYPIGQVLYYLDRDAYIDALRMIEEDTADESVDDDCDAIDDEQFENDGTGLWVAEEAPRDQGDAAQSSFQNTSPDQSNKESRSSYNGIFSEYISQIYNHLYYEVGIQSFLSAEETLEITNRILIGFEPLNTPDWGQHSSTVARVRTMMKRNMRSFGLDENLIHRAAESLVLWLQNKMVLAEVNHVD